MVIPNEAGDLLFFRTVPLPSLAHRATCHPERPFARRTSPHPLRNTPAPAAHHNFPQPVGAGETIRQYRKRRRRGTSSPKRHISSTLSPNIPIQPLAPPLISQ